MASSTRAVPTRGLVAATCLAMLLSLPALPAAKKKKSPAVVLLGSAVHDAFGSDDDGASAALLLKRRYYLVGYATGVADGRNATLTDFNAKLAAGGSWGHDGGAGGHDRFDAVAANASGEVFAVGSATRPGNGLDVYVQKYHERVSGAAQSVYIGTDFGDDAAHGVAVAPDGTLYVVGEQAVPGGATWLWFGKLDAELNVLDQSSYLGPLEHATAARAVAIDASGDLVVAGAVPRAESGDDIWVGKFDTRFNLLGEAFGAGHADGDDSAYGIAIDRRGRIWVCGSIATETQGHDVWLGGFDADLAPLGAVTRSGPVVGDDAARAIVADRRGHLFLVGRAADADGGHVPWVGVFDTHLQLVTDATVDVPAAPRDDDHDGARSVLLLPKNGLFVTGGVTGPEGDGDTWLARFKAKRLPKVKSP